MGLRVIIPQELQPKLITELHRNHLGIVKMKAVARSHFWRPGPDKDIESALVKIVRKIGICQRNPPSIPGDGRKGHGNAYTLISVKKREIHS